MKQKLTISIQDYLKVIYELTESGENASTNALAQKMKVIIQSFRLTGSRLI